MRIDFTRKIKRENWNNVHMDFESVGDSAQIRQALWVLDRHTGHGKSLSVSSKYIMDCFRYYTEKGYLEESIDDSLVYAAVQNLIIQQIEAIHDFSTEDEVFSCLKETPSFEVEELPEPHRKNFVFDVENDPEQKKVARLLNAADARTRVMLVCRFVFAYIAGENEPDFIDYYAKREFQLMANAYHRIRENPADPNFRLFVKTIISMKNTTSRRPAKATNDVVHRTLLDILDNEK